VQVVDSDKEELDTSAILVMAVQELYDEGFIDANKLPMQASLLALTREGAMETSDTVQMGNTVFIGHTGKDANKNKMVTRPFNVDTGRNYIRNCIKYLQYLQEKGTTHVTATSDSDKLLPLMKILQKRLQKTEDSALYIGKTEDDKYIVYIKLGKDPIR
tara:strand:+ start:1972 stop:2448 length:477 start_codon:yes stop_codon:yes gene_type:complete